MHRCMLRVVVEAGDATATFELCDYLLKDIPSLDYDELVDYLMISFFCLCNLKFLCTLS